MLVDPVVYKQELGAFGLRLVSSNKFSMGMKVLMLSCLKLLS